MAKRKIPLSGAWRVTDFYRYCYMKLSTFNLVPSSFARSTLAACILSTLVASALAAEEPSSAPGVEAPAVETPVATATNPNDLPLPLDEVRIFAQVLNQIRSAYVEPIDDK